MDADRSNRFINNKPTGVIATAAIAANGCTPGATGQSGGSLEASEPSSAAEPPKQKFNNSNAKNNDSKNLEQSNIVDCEHDQQHQQKNNVEKYTNSVRLLSNESNATIVSNLLSDEINSAVSAAASVSSIVASNKQNSINNNNNKNDKNSDGDCRQQQHELSTLIRQKEIIDDKTENSDDNDDFDAENVDIDDRNMVNGTNTRDRTDSLHIDKTIINTSVSSNLIGARRMNKSDNDIDNESQSAANSETESATDGGIANNHQSLTISSKENSVKSATKLSSPVNLTEDCISSTDTFSSDSIDVRSKCHDEEEEEERDEDHNGERTNGVGINTSKQAESTSPPSTAAMDDFDSSLRIPLLGKNNSNSSANDYNAIERSDDDSQKRTKGILDKSVDFDQNDKGIRSSKQRVLYNDYVNLLCDTDLSGGTKNNRSNSTNGNFTRDENRPLLQQQNDCKTKRKPNQKPKSIVKSPSTQNFGTNSGEKFCEANRKPRLSIQCTGSDPERPVLHVQFLSQHNRHNGNDDNNRNKNDAYFSKSYPPPSALQSYQSSKVPASSNAEFAEKQNNQGPGPSILRNSRMRSSISSSSSESSSSSDSSDSSSSDDVSQFAEAKPPDGGWGWVIVFASFMVNLIADGITFSFGVIYVELLKYFGEGKAKTAWIGSLFMAMPLLSGPIASFLTDRYGCRKVTIAGSILASIGFFISSFTDSIEMLFFTFGIFAGFGLSLCYVAAVVIVAYYFDKRRSFATGLSVCGSGIGTFIFAPLTQFLIDEYGWRGTTLILSGMFLNMTVCGMLMRDLEWTTYKSKQKAKLRKKRNKLGISADSFSVSNSTNTGGTTSNLHKDESNGNELDRSDENNGDTSITNQSESFDENPRMFSSLISLPTFVKNGEKVPVEVLELLSANHNIHNVLLKNYPGLAHSRSFSQPLTSSRHSNASNFPMESGLSPTGGTIERDGSLSKSKNRRIRNEQAFLTWLKEDQSIHHPKDVRMMMNRNHPTTAYLKDLRMHRHSLTYRGAMLNINRYRLRASSCPDIYRNSMTTIAKEKNQWGQGVDEFKAVLMDMLDFSFFTDIRFTLFALSNFFLYAWYDVPYVYLADNAVEIGFSETDASILISLIGIVNMFGEIILGWFGDRKFITAGMIYAICMVFCGLVTSLVPLLTTYTGLSVLSGLFGLFIAANYALTSIILVELITLDRFTNAYGLLLLVQGIANLIGPPLAGWITDVTGNYDLAFYLAGLFIAISGVLMFILPARGRIKKYRAIRRGNLSGQDDEDDDDDEEGDDEEDVESRAGTRKSDRQNIVAPKSALKFNGNANNNFIDSSTKANQV